MSIFELLFEQISKYLNDDYLEKIESNNLASINKYIRKKYYYWKLTINYSNEYYKNNEFRNILNLLLSCPRKQVLLNLYINTKNIIINNAAANLYSLKLIHTNISFNINILHIHILNLSYTSISDLKILKNSKIYNLNLSWCKNIINSQLQYINHIPIINLEGCKISSLNNFENNQNIKKLNLGYNLILNIDALKNSTITDLDLSKCTTLNNIILLPSLKYLNLHYCQEFINFKIFSLSNIYVLNLSYTFITNNDLQYLINITNLDLTGCRQLTNIIKLKNNKIKVLNISYCTLYNLKFLNIESLNIESIIMAGTKIYYYY